MTFYDGHPDKKRKYRDLQLMLLKKPNRVDNITSRVPKPKDPLPSNPLPLWKNLSLDDKVPFVPAPEGTFTLSRSKIGEQIFLKDKNICFDILDPYIHETPTAYDPLHDPHLKEFFQLHPAIVDRLLDIDLVTRNGEVKCSLSELNKYRQYLSRVHKCLIHAEREREEQWERFEREQLEKIKKWFIDKAKKLREEEQRRRRLKIKSDYEKRMALSRRKQREHPSNFIKDLRARENAIRKSRREAKRKNVALRVARLRNAERKRIKKLIVQWLCEEQHAVEVKEYNDYVTRVERDLNLQAFIDLKRECQEKKLRHHRAVLILDNSERNCQIDRRQDYYNRREVEMREEVFEREARQQRRDERINYLMDKYGRRWLALTRRNHHDGMHDSSWHVRKHLQDSGKYLKEMSGAKSFTSFLAAILKPKKKKDVWEGVQDETKIVVKEIVRDVIRNTYKEIVRRATTCLVDFAVDEARKLCLTAICEEGLDPADLEEPIYPVRKKIVLERHPPLWPCTGPCAQFGLKKGGRDWQSKCTKMADALGSLHDELTDQLSKKFCDDMDNLFPGALAPGHMRGSVEGARRTCEMDEAAKTVAGIAMDRASSEPADDDMQDEFTAHATDRLAASLQSGRRQQREQEELDARFALAQELVDAEMGGQLANAQEKQAALVKALGLEDEYEDEEEDGVGALIAKVLDEQQKKLNKERKGIKITDDHELRDIVTVDDENVDRIGSGLVNRVLYDDYSDSQDEDEEVQNIVQGVLDEESTDCREGPCLDELPGAGTSGTKPSGSPDEGQRIQPTSSKAAKASKLPTRPVSTKGSKKNLPTSSKSVVKPGTSSQRVPGSEQQQGKGGREEPSTSKGAGAGQSQGPSSGQPKPSTSKGGGTGQAQGPSSGQPKPSRPVSTTGSKKNLPPSSKAAAAKSLAIVEEKQAAISKALGLEDEEGDEEEDEIPSQTQSQKPDGQTTDTSDRKRSEMDEGRTPSSMIAPPSSDGPAILDSDQKPSASRKASKAEADKTVPVRQPSTSLTPDLAEQTGVRPERQPSTSQKPAQVEQPGVKSVQEPSASRKSLQAGQPVTPSQVAQNAGVLEKAPKSSPSQLANAQEKQGAISKPLGSEGAPKDEGEDRIPVQTQSQVPGGQTTDTSDRKRSEMDEGRTPSTMIPPPTSDGTALSDSDRKPSASRKASKAEAAGVMPVQESSANVKPDQAESPGDKPVQESSTNVKPGQGESPGDERVQESSTSLKAGEAKTPGDKPVQESSTNVKSGQDEPPRVTSVQETSASRKSLQAGQPAMSPQEAQNIGEQETAPQPSPSQLANAQEEQAALLKPSGLEGTSEEEEDETEDEWQDAFESEGEGEEEDSFAAQIAQDLEEQQQSANAQEEQGALSRPLGSEGAPEDEGEDGIPSQTQNQMPDGQSTDISGEGLSEVEEGRTPSTMVPPPSSDGTAILDSEQEPSTSLNPDQAESPGVIPGREPSASLKPDQAEPTEAMSAKETSASRKSLQAGQPVISTQEVQNVNEFDSTPSQLANAQERQEALLKSLESEGGPKVEGEDRIPLQTPSQMASGQTTEELQNALTSAQERLSQIQIRRASADQQQTQSRRGSADQQQIQSRRGSADQQQTQSRRGSADQQKIEGLQSESDDALSQRVSELIRLVLTEQRGEVQKETDMARSGVESLPEDFFDEDNLSRVGSALAIQSICAKYKSMINLQARLCGDTAPEMTDSLVRLVRDYICSDPNLVLEGFTGGIQCPPKEGGSTEKEKATRFASDVQVLHYHRQGDRSVEPSQAPSVSPSTGALVSTVNVQPAPSSWYQHPHIPSESYFRVQTNDPSGFRVMVPPNQMPEPSTVGLPVGPSILDRIAYGVQESTASYMDPAYHHLTSAHGLSEVHAGRTVVFPSTMMPAGSAIPTTDPSGFQVMVAPNQMPEPSTFGLPVGTSTVNGMAYGVQESTASYLDPTYHPVASAHGQYEVHDGRTVVFPSTRMLPPAGTAILDSDQEPSASLKSFKAGPPGVMSVQEPSASLKSFQTEPPVMSPQEVQNVRELQTARHPLPSQVRVTVREHLRKIRNTLDEIKRTLQEDDPPPPPPQI